MSNVKFTLNRAGVRELLNSKEMDAVLAEWGGKIAERAGKGYDYNMGHSSQRSKATVTTASFGAMRDNANNNTLLKALGGGS